MVLEKEGCGAPPACCKGTSRALLSLAAERDTSVCPLFFAVRKAVFRERNQFLSFAAGSTALSGASAIRFHTFHEEATPDTGKSASRATVQNTSQPEPMHPST